MHRLLQFSLCLLLLVALLALTFRQQTSSAQTTSFHIGVRNAHAIVYDSDRKRVVLFGGADAARVCSETWEWDGKRWTRVSTNGPGPRTFPAMTYDSIRRRVVMFGGNQVLFGRNLE